TVTNGGSGYTAANVPVAFSPPPSGITAAGTATIVDGKVTAVNRTNNGSGYTTAPKVTIAFDAASRKVVDVNADGSKVTFNNVPKGPAGTTARKIYRAVFGSNVFTLVGTINDNTVTAFTDSGTGPFDPLVSEPSRPAAPNVIAAGTTGKDGGTGGRL